MFPNLRTKKVLQLTTILLWFTVGLLGVLFLHTTLTYDPFRGFDAAGHVEYIEYLKSQRRIPLAYEGWELYQPPLYYLLVMLLPSLKLVQFFGFFLFVLFLTILYRSLSARFSEQVARVTTIITASLPVGFTLMPAIGNEFFSGLIIALTLLFYIEVVLKRPGWKTQLVFGILLGMALLSKATALILIPTFFIHQVLLTKRIRKAVLFLWQPFVVAAILGGWFYARNWLVLGGPLTQSIDYPQYAITQLPGYRDLRFFTDISPFVTLDIFKAHWYSLWAGTYFTWFYDGHNLLVPIQPFSKAGMLLVVMSYPLFGLSVVGLWRIMRQRKNPLHVLIIYAGLLWVGYIFYNFKLPFYSTVKGAFLVSLLLPFAYFFAHGVEKFPKIARYLPFYLLVYCLILFRHFYYLGTGF